MVYTGTLTHQAEARTRLLDGDLHAVPVLCLDIELDNVVRTRMHVEQAFPADHHKQAEAAARRLKKGMHVTVEAPLVGVQIVARNATHIHTHDDPTTNPEAPCQASLLP